MTVDSPGDSLLESQVADLPMICNVALLSFSPIRKDLYQLQCIVCRLCSSSHQLLHGKTLPLKVKLATIVHYVKVANW